MQRRRLLSGLATGAAAAGLSACGASSLWPWGNDNTGSFDVENMPVLSEAPEISSTTWINSEPITLAGLRGNSAVGIAFWTYG